jgi:hypothetical protein
LGALGRVVTVRRLYAQPPAELQTRRRLIALGDSITIGAIDCELLDELAGPAGYVSYNLAVPAKAHSEYLLDLAQPALQGSLLVTCVNPASTYAPAALQLGERRANMIRVLDYPLPVGDELAYAQLVPDSGIAHLLLPRYQHVFESRWRIQESLGTQLRLALPIVPEENKRALRYRREVYSRNLKAAAMPVELTEQEARAALEQRAAEDPRLFSPDYRPTPEALASYAFLVERMATVADKVVLVIAPLHPAQRERLGEAGLAAFRRQIDSYASDKVVVLDFSGLLDASGFRDEIHHNQRGAQRITRALAEALGLADAAPAPAPALAAPAG